MTLFVTTSILMFVALLIMRTQGDMYKQIANILLIGMILTDIYGFGGYAIDTYQYAREQKRQKDLMELEKFSEQWSKDYQELKKEWEKHSKEIDKAIKELEAFVNEK